MALIITKKVKTVLLIVLAVLVVGGGGFLIWRVTQEESVAPEDSEAGCNPPCVFHSPIGECVGPGMCRDVSDCEKCKSGEFCHEGWLCCDICDGGDSPGGMDCVCGKDVRYCSTCKNYEDDCIGEFGACGCYGWGDNYGDCYNVKYDGNGGTCTPATITVQTGKPASVTVSCSRSGYRVSSFTKVSGSANLNTSNGTLTNVTSHVVIKANWTRVVSSHTVTYSAGSGGTCTPSSRTVNNGGTSKAPSCSRSGYNLNGFKKSKGTCGTLTTSSGAVSNVTCDLTITAQWEQLQEVVDPACSARAKGYPYDATGWGSENIGFCKVGSSATPKYSELNDSFPEPGETVTWVCANSEGSVDCEASRADVDDPSCGTLSTNYAAETTSWPEGSFCNVGSSLPADPTFPIAGSSTEWVCGTGTNLDGTFFEEVNCLATRESAPDGPIPQTGIFDTVLGRVSVGVSFIFLGGLVTQYSKINYMFNSISEKNQFRKEINKQRRRAKRTAKRRSRLEDRFK